MCQFKSPNASFGGSGLSRHIAISSQCRQKLSNHIPDPIQTILGGESHRGYPFPEHNPIHPVVPILIVLEDWPDKQAQDLGMVYTSFVGDGNCEAVTVVLTQEDGAVRIRSLEWGRP